MRAPRRLPCGLMVGLSHEGAYLGRELEPALGTLMVAPASTGTGIEAWRVATLAALVKCRDLSFISIWSPTFLLELIEALPREADKVLRLLRADDSEDARAAAVRLEGGLSARVADTTRLWPGLDTVSMWTDGASGPYAQRVTELFPQVHIDAKGVLATESAMTLRVDDAPGCIPALTSAVLEFIDERDMCLSAHELERTATYRVVITTPGGLYRYDTGDEVRCIDVRNGVPRLQFIGRAGLVSDLVGEKLTDRFAAGVLAGLAQPVALVPRDAPNPHYEIWIDAADSGRGHALAADVDARLRRNVQYAYARDLGQLRAPVAIFHPGFAQHRRHVLAARGHRLGDVKLSALILDSTTLPAPNGGAAGQ